MTMVRTVKPDRRESKAVIESVPRNIEPLADRPSGFTEGERDLMEIPRGTEPCDSGRQESQIHGKCRYNG
jgi:hypothetical protein